MVMQNLSVNMVKVTGNFTLQCTPPRKRQIKMQWNFYAAKSPN